MRWRCMTFFDWNALDHESALAFAVAWRLPTPPEPSPEFFDWNALDHESALAFAVAWNALRVSFQGGEAGLLGDVAEHRAYELTADEENEKIMAIRRIREEQKAHYQGKAERKAERRKRRKADGRKSAPRVAASTLDLSARFAEKKADCLARELGY